MEHIPLQQVEQLALKKHHIYEVSKLTSLLRAMLASMFIGFGVIVAFKSGGAFYNEHSPLAYPMAALTFGSAIILISYGGGDLFTGNTFYFTIAALRRKLAWPTVARMWLLCYIGNVLGAFAFALLIWSTGLFSDASVNGFLLSVVEKKLHASTFELFFRAILCNWLVCLAFFIPMSMKGDGPKLFTMMLFVFCFFISGYEHSVANMCTFAIGLVVGEPGQVTLGGIIHNLIPVTLGNMVGGAILMGFMYHTVNKPFEEEGNHP